MKETHSRPHETYPLEQDPLARRRCFRSDELRGHSGELGHAGHDRNADRADQREHERYDEHQRAAPELDISETVHHPVHFPDDPREELDASEITRHTAQHGSGSRVDNVLHDYREFRITETAHRAYEVTFVRDHAAHSCRAHERRYRKEEHREHGRDSVYDLRIVIETDISHVGVSSEHICIRFLDRIEKRISRIYLQSRLDYRLRIERGHTFVILRKAVVVFCPSVFQFLGRFFELILTFVVIRKALVVLRKAVVIQGKSRFVLRFAVQEFRVALVVFCKTVVVLRLGIFVRCLLRFKL